MNKNDVMAMAAQVASAYISRNQISQSDVMVLLKGIHGTLDSLATGTVEQPIGSTTPAVPIKKSVTDAYIVCLEDGKRLKMLKRYLRSHFDMSPEDYRRKWRLAPDYPMVAPAYARQRSDFAKSIGLGTSANVDRGRRKAAK